MGQSLKRVNPQYHRGGYFNPVAYYAEYVGHFQQNENLIRYSLTEVIAVDGRSSFITAKSVMPLKSNLVIYQEMFR